MTIPQIWADPLRDVQQIPPAAWCIRCRAELYPGEGCTLCPRCRAAQKRSIELEEELDQHYDLTGII